MLRLAVFICDGCRVEAEAPRGGGMPEGWERGVFGLGHVCLGCRQYIAKYRNEAVSSAVARLRAKPPRRLA